MGNNLLKTKTMKAKTTITIFSILAIVGLSLHSCKKDKDPTPTTPAAATGMLAFHIHTNIDTMEVEDYDSVYTTTAGRKIAVHKSQLYISNIQAVKLDGSTYDITGIIKLMKQGEEEYVIGNVPAGNYKSIKFNVGLSATTNAAIPANSDSTLNQPAMWFGNTAQPSGFIFLNFEGTIDTTTAGNASVSQMQTFNYKIGTGMNLKTVTMPDQNYTVSADQVQYIHMVADYNMLFDGIQLNLSSNLNVVSPSDNATMLGMQIANNIPMMFRYEM
jgi:hypothetical protein